MQNEIFELKDQFKPIPVQTNEQTPLGRGTPDVQNRAFYVAHVSFAYIRLHSEL